MSSFFDQALEATTQIVEGLGDEDILFFPVRDREVEAYIAEGNQGVEVAGMLDFEPVENDDGDGAIVDNIRIIFRTDYNVVKRNNIRKGTAIKHRGVIYDVARVLPDDPAGYNVYLRDNPP